MKRGWYVLVALSIGVAGGGAGYAEADPLSIVSIQAVGPIGTQNASGATHASTSLSFGQNLNEVDAFIGETHGLAHTNIAQGPGSLISDVIRISTQVTLSDPNFPDCVVVVCESQVGGSLFLILAGDTFAQTDEFPNAFAGATASASGSTGLDSTGRIILLAFDTSDGLPPHNAVIDNGHDAITSTSIRFLPLGTYFLDIQLTVFESGPGLVDFAHSFHDFVEVADGVTFSETTGLLPLGPPSSAPEPETYALMLAGLGALGFVTRRRKQKKAAAA